MNYVLSLPQDEGLIEITRWRWALSKRNMDASEELAWDKWVDALEKKVRNNP